MEIAGFLLQLLAHHRDSLIQAQQKSGTEFLGLPACGLMLVRYRVQMGRLEQQVRRAQLEVLEQLDQLDL